MKFLMYSEAGEGAHILQRIGLEGNDVAIYIKDKRYKSVFDGILPKLNSSSDALASEPDVVIFDQSGNGNIADTFINRDIYTYGGSSLCDKLEKDREFGITVMKKCGIKIPYYKSFTDFEYAKSYVRETNDKLVFKPSGDLPCKLTFVPQDSNELIEYMDFVNKKYGKYIKCFVLQEFIEGPIISTEAFCNGREFLRPFNHTIEVKKAYNDNLGPSTGCSGNIVWLADESKITKEGIERAEEFFVNNNYIGQVDINTIVNDKGVYGLEWTPRFGYDATPTFMNLLNIDFGEFFYNICNSKDNGDLSLVDKFAGGLRVSIPPYPVEVEGKMDSEELSPNLGVPILNYESYLEDMYLYEVMYENYKLVHAGGTGVVTCTMGIGDDPKGCLEYPYKIAENLHIPDKMYRTDLKEVLNDMYKEVIKYV